MFYNEMNKFFRAIVVAPITSSSKSYPTRVEIRQTRTKGWVVLDQIRTVGRVRIIRKLGSLTKISVASLHRCCRRGKTRYAVNLPE